MPANDPLPKLEKPKGIVDSKIDEAQGYKAPEVKPITTDVDSKTETVESRLNDLTASGSRYVELARSDAQREANNRGLVNSTMAGAAGVDAAVRNAMPIAEADARTYTDTRMKNQDTENKFLENRQNTNLNMESDTQKSNLTRGEQNNQSSLTDKENRVLNELNIERMEIDNDLKIKLETTMNDEKFSDESKLQIIATMNNIVRDSNQQITDVGMSDRSAAQQATAIDMIRKNRDAELSVYQDLLAGFNDWDWGTNFTPESITTVAQDNNYWNAPGNAKPITEPKIGDTINGQRYEGNGVWNSDWNNNNDWNDF